MNNNSGNVVYIHRGKVCISDGDSGLLGLRSEVYVQKTVEIKLALNLITIADNRGNSFPRPHFISGSCVG